MRPLTTLLASVVIAAGAQVPEQGSFAVRNVRVFDGERMLPRATVVVAAGVIRAVGVDAPVPPNVEVIDGAGRTLLPGLIDSHTHTGFRSQLTTSLAFGVTTHLDMLTGVTFADAMRAEQDSGKAHSRADLYSARVAVTVAGGHGSDTRPPLPMLSSADDADAFVKARVAEGADYIKLIVDDASAYGRSRPTLSATMVTAVIAAAHQQQKLAVVHVARLADAIAAVRAGADGLVHVWLDSRPDADVLTEFRHRRVFVIPTLAVWNARLTDTADTRLLNDSRVERYLPNADIQRLKTVSPLKENAQAPADYVHARASVQALHRAGIRILAGSDGNNPGTAFGATLHRELELLVDAGLSPIDALAAATAAPAEAFHLTDRGRIVVGRSADLLLVDGDPATDITALRSIARVWKRGHVFDRASYAAKVAAERTPKRPVPILLSDFEDGLPATVFGSDWLASSDAFFGGNSRARAEVVRGGVAAGGQALRISGEVAPGFSAPASGVLYFPGGSPQMPVDLSGSKGFRFSARGDGATYRVTVTLSRNQQLQPRTRTFIAGVQWQQQSFQWSDFDGDGRDVERIQIVAGPTLGRYELLIDDIEFY